MTMEERKIAWANRIYDAVKSTKLPMIEYRRLTSICQDAFNEGHKAGETSATDRLCPDVGFGLTEENYK